MKKNSDGSLHLEKEDILNHIKNRPPLFMLDFADVVPGISSISSKYLKEDEWYFVCHFPGDPKMPGVLQLETLFQTSALAIKTLPGNREKTSNIARIKDVVYNDSILPGMTIDVKTQIQSYKRGVAKVNGRIEVEGKIMCSAEYVLSIPEDMVFIGEVRKENGNDK